VVVRIDNKIQVFRYDVYTSIDIWWLSRYSHLMFLWLFQYLMPTPNCCCFGNIYTVTNWLNIRCLWLINHTVSD
jgi:hypothetical protein